jgi:hypothetical protein
MKLKKKIVTWFYVKISNVTSTNGIPRGAKVYLSLIRNMKIENGMRRALLNVKG